MTLYPLKMLVYRFLVRTVRWCGPVWWQKDGESPYLAWDTPPWVVVGTSDDYCGCVRKYFTSYVNNREDRYGEYFVIAEDAERLGLLFTFKLYGPEPHGNSAQELSDLMRPLCHHREKVKFYDTWQGGTHAQSISNE